MNIPLATVATFFGGIAITISGYFAINERALADRVDTISTDQAAQVQYAKDIDARLTRIENKLDKVISTDK